ncbi:hypothetical protein METSCH_A08300 [Metschnikowia aff. pulcherrima]|uniref:Uncharacterized protein n=1 Tax=Metschnikowia aff. pulcherrima TaxID=2163413 RepID=A0A4P6XKV3_9ASCO|nr:hypothetical protein METSCH_A08300 [Metschnikowia aff. pulcherrima]
MNLRGVNPYKISSIRQKTFLTETFHEHPQLVMSTPIHLNFSTAPKLRHFCPYMFMTDHYFPLNTSKRPGSLNWRFSSFTASFYIYNGQFLAFLAHMFVGLPKPFYYFILNGIVTSTEPNKGHCIRSIYSLNLPPNPVYTKTIKNSIFQPNHFVSCLEISDLSHFESRPRFARSYFFSSTQTALNHQAYKRSALEGPRTLLYRQELPITS